MKLYACGKYNKCNPVMTRSLAILIVYELLQTYVKRTLTPSRTTAPRNLTYAKPFCSHAPSSPEAHTITPPHKQ